MLPRLADSIRSRIALFIVLSLGTVAGALVAMGYRATTARSVAAAETAMSTAAEQAATVLDKYLAPIPELLAAAAAVAHPDPESDAAFVELGVALLRAHPPYYQLYRATPDGGFLAIADADPRLVAELGLPAAATGGFVRNRIDGATGIQRLAWRTADDQTWHAVAERPSTYDPRDRIWYVRASGTAGVQLAAPYKFSFADVLGITAAAAKRDAAGALVSIVALDMLLDDLADAIARIRVPGNGRRLLAFADGALLTHPSLDGLRTGGIGSAPRITQLAGTADDIDLKMFEAGAARPGALTRVTSNGRTWIGTAQPLPSSMPRRIVMVTAAPLDVLTRAGRRDAERELIVGTALLVLAVAAAIALSRPAISRPIERLAAAAHRIREDGGLGAVAMPRGGTAEIRELSSALSEMVAALRARAAELAALNADLERRVQVRTAELAEARDRAEDAARAKATFLATMSHEIRTPMTGVVGMLDLLADGRLDAGQRELVEVCMNSATMLRTIIDDILDFSKIEAGKLALESLPIDLEILAGDVADLLATRAASAGLALVIDIDPAAPRRITGDPARLRQVLVNLVGNAIKFTKTGHVVIRIGPLRDGVIELAVTDTGIGLTAEQRARLFRPFEQAEAGTARQYGGTGLGLAICRRLVELMGGTIGVDSVPGAGSTFWLRVPPGAIEPPAAGRPLEGLAVALAIGEPALAAVIARDLAAAGAAVGAAAPAVIVTDDARSPTGTIRRVLLLPRAHRTAGTVGPDTTVCPIPVRPSALVDAVAIAGGRRAAPAQPAPEVAADVAPLPAGLRIVVAEDTPNSRLAIARMLEREGVAPILCENGAVAWQHLETRPCDLLITDCNMPELDGYALARRLRALEAAQPARPRTPICALSASVLQDEIDQCFAAGMDCFLPKPIVRKELARMLREQLGGAAAGAPPPAPAAAEASDPVLDLAEFEALFGGVTEELKTIVRDFVGLAHDQIRQLQAEIDRGDPGTAAQTAHALAGNALSTGAVALGRRVRAVETALKRGTIEAARAGVPTIEAALAALETRVAAL